jgi:hypothetical protein
MGGYASWPAWLGCYEKVGEEVYVSQTASNLLKPLLRADRIQRALASKVGRKSGIHLNEILLLLAIHIPLTQEKDARITA